jgi:hypothetical protein
MATLPSSPGASRSPPAPPDLTEWIESALLWLADEMNRRTEGRTPGPWLSAEEAAEYTRIPYPSFRKIAKRIPRRRYGEQSFVYHRDELDAWLLADANRYWEDT